MLVPHIWHIRKRKLGINCSTPPACPRKLMLPMGSIFPDRRHRNKEREREKTVHMAISRCRTMPFTALLTAGTCRRSEVCESGEFTESHQISPATQHSTERSVLFKDFHVVVIAKTITTSTNTCHVSQHNVASHPVASCPSPRWTTRLHPRSSQQRSPSQRLETQDQSGKPREGIHDFKIPKTTRSDSLERRRG